MRSAIAAIGVMLAGCTGTLGDGAGGGGPGGAGGMGGSTPMTTTAAVGGAGGTSSTSTDASSSSSLMGDPCVADGVTGVCVNVSECTGNNMSVPGFCPGPTEIQCCVPKDPNTCDPDAHVFPNDGLVEAPGVGGCPKGMLKIPASSGLPAFCVDKYEASLVDVNGGASICPFHNPGTMSVRAVSIAGAIPQAYINGEQAADACANAGKRLCDDDEWLRACRGPTGNIYPYGNTRIDGLCNDHRDQHPAVEYYGSSEAWVYSHIDNACLDQLHDSLDPAGANAGCVSDDGAFDMMGNLHEWTADPAGTFRGGYFVDTKINGEGCLYATTAHNTLHWDYSTGFRCCADP
ncbi:MAG: SUMF1/EgtB/PvdO family nonheme iron enzyme [Polyangiaceae bacterium]